MLLGRSTMDEFSQFSAPDNRSYPTKAVHIHMRMFEQLILKWRQHSFSKFSTGKLDSFHLGFLTSVYECQLFRLTSTRYDLPKRANFWSVYSENGLHHVMHMHVQRQLLLSEFRVHAHACLCIRREARR